MFTPPPPPSYSFNPFQRLSVSTSNSNSSYQQQQHYGYSIIPPPSSSPSTLQSTIMSQDNPSPPPPPSMMGYHHYIMEAPRVGRYYTGINNHTLYQHILPIPQWGQSTQQVQVGMAEKLKGEGYRGLNDDGIQAPPNEVIIIEEDKREGSNHERGQLSKPQYPQTARGEGGGGQQHQQPVSSITVGSATSEATPLDGLGINHNGSDIMELQLAVHALELENIALRRRVKDRTKALNNAQARIQSLQESLVEAELKDTSPAAAAVAGDFQHHISISDDLRGIVALLTKAGEVLNKPKECGKLLVKAAEAIAAIDGKIRSILTMTNTRVTFNGGGGNDMILSLKDEVKVLKGRLNEAERMISNSHAREFDLLRTINNGDKGNDNQQPIGGHLNSPERVGVGNGSQPNRKRNSSFLEELAEHGVLPAQMMYNEQQQQPEVATTLHQQAESRLSTSYRHRRGPRDTL